MNSPLSDSKPNVHSEGENKISAVQTLHRTKTKSHCTKTIVYVQCCYCEVVPQPAPVSRWKKMFGFWVFWSLVAFLLFLSLQLWKRNFEFFFCFVTHLGLLVYRTFIGLLLLLFILVSLTNYILLWHRQLIWFNLFSFYCLLCFIWELVLWHFSLGFLYSYLLFFNL